MQLLCFPVLALLLPTGPKEDLDTVVYTIGEQRSYPIRIARADDLVAIFTEIPCTHTGSIENGHFEIRFLSEAAGAAGRSASQEHIVLARLRAKAPVGYSATVPLICRGQIIIPLLIQVVSEKERTAKVYFRLSPEREAHIETARVAARWQAQELCERQRKQDAILQQSRSQRMLMRGIQESFALRDIDLAAKSKGRRLLLYIERVHRFAGYAVVSFRLENVSPAVLHIGEVEIAAHGSAYRETRVIAAEKQQLEARELLRPLEDITAALENGTAPLEVDLGHSSVQKTSIEPGESVDASVMFPFPWAPGSAGAVEMSVRSTQGDEVRVSRISFPPGRSR